MKISGHLRRICCACQRPSGNKRFHADLFKQRQVSRGNPAGNGKLKTDIGKRFHACQIGLAPLLPAGLRVTTTMINRLSYTNTMPVTGIVQRPVAEQFYPYIRPQETGTKTDIRWWRLLNIGGNGLQFVSDAPFSASALNYTIESLDDGAGKDQRHSPEVEKANFTNFCIDKAQTGLACVNSWGAIPLEKYRLPYQDYELSFIMTPVYHKLK